MLGEGPKSPSLTVVRLAYRTLLTAKFSWPAESVLPAAMNEKPIPESYWVLPGRLLAGAYPALRLDPLRTRQRLAAFISAGFDTFIDLTVENERPPYSSLLAEEALRTGSLVRHQRIPFPDFDIPSRLAMLSALDAVDAALAAGGRVYLHCVGGIGRTGMTVGCYFIRHGMPPQEAVNRLQEAYLTSLQSLTFHQSPETGRQLDFILDWPELG